MGKSYSTTTITDLRQAAEAQVVSGVGSQLALPGGFALGEGATFSVTGADTAKTFEQMLSNTDSTLGKVLGLTSQLAQGLFEQGPAIARAVTVPTSAALANIGNASQMAAAGQTSATNKLIIAVLVGLGLLMLFARK